jgi:hypothetical protein
MSLVKGLTTTNTRKNKKVKFKSAQEKKEFESYQKWRKSYVESLTPPPKPKAYKPDYSFVRETPVIQSLNDVGIVAGRKEPRKYEGERTLIGIATMHKSNMVPVFSQEDAESISKMRRG